MKLCTKCKDIKNVENFHNDRSRKDGKYPWCKSCVRDWNINNSSNPHYKEYKTKYQREYAKRPERRQQIAAYQQTEAGKRCKRRSKLKQKYSLDEATYNFILKSQKNACAVCRNPLTITKHTHIDHCHTTGIIRGILCNHCNRALGAVKDSTLILRNLINYLDTTLDKRIIPVVVESPYKGNIYINRAYARQCLRDCLFRGESPFASHLIYTQSGVLDDSIEEERNLGIEAGLEWGKFAAKTIVYTDLGVSIGMQYGINRAQNEGRMVEYRTLPDWKEPSIEDAAKIAYQAYGDTTDWKNYLGLPMPLWAQLPDKIREAWVAAAKALTK
jgi:hypothetical protein